MVLISELLLLVVSAVLGQAFVPILSTERNFVPSAWNGPLASESQPVVSVASATSGRSAEATGRKYGGSHQPKRSYGHKKTHYHKTEISIDPSAIVLRCKIQEPLEHVVWIRSRCPGGYEHEDNLVAEGATVQDKSLYDVRILGGNSTISSELLVKQPLEASSAGMYRCEAWPHGGGGPPYGQFAANDVYIIGGKEMLRHCFGGWESTHEPFEFDSYGGGKHRSSSSEGQKNYIPRYSGPNDLRGSGTSKVESNTERVPPTTTSKHQNKYQYPHIPSTRNRNRPSEVKHREPELEVTTAKPQIVRINVRPTVESENVKNQNSRFSEDAKPSRFETSAAVEPTVESFENLVKEYNKYLLQQQINDVNVRTNPQPQTKNDNYRPQTTSAPTTLTTPSSVAPRNYIMATTPPAHRLAPRDSKPFMPSAQFPSFRSADDKVEEVKPPIILTTQRPGRTDGPIWNVDEIMNKNSFTKIDSRSSKALYGLNHGTNGTVEKFEQEASTMVPKPAVIVVMAEKAEDESKVNQTLSRPIKSVDF